MWTACAQISQNTVLVIIGVVRCSLTSLRCWLVRGSKSKPGTKQDTKRPSCFVSSFPTSSYSGLHHRGCPIRITRRRTKSKLPASRYTKSSEYHLDEERCRVISVATGQLEGRRVVRILLA
ncbi:hypothetical protein CPB86DRAFT_500463 [Serendipita vermifera]|nr:hypothetical protein CPB86DRAFT_500463 [Serendipita vermifera]